MVPELEDRMWKAGSGQKLEESTWRAIVHELLRDFRVFLSEAFEIDADVKIDPEVSTFSTWIWSAPRSPLPLSVSWSAVLAGSPVGDPSDRDSFVVSVTLFLFHELGSKRLISSDGKHFLEFSFERGKHGGGEWRFVGWQKDEWGEWKDLQLSDSAE
jgi:hypothetical protein